jgi:hypothetical protein
MRDFLILFHGHRNAARILCQAPGRRLAIALTLAK